MIPTIGEEYAKLCEHLRKAQESAAMLAHLHNAEGLRGTIRAKGWLAISEGMKLMLDQVQKLATGRLQ